MMALQWSYNWIEKYQGDVWDQDGCKKWGEESSVREEGYNTKKIVGRLKKMEKNLQNPDPALAELGNWICMQIISHSMYCRIK